MQRRLGSLLAVHDPLVEIGRPKAPDAAGEVNVVAVVDFRQVIKGAGLLRVGKQVGTPLVGDLDEALFDVDVRRPVLAHRAELDEMDRGIDLCDRVEEVQGADDIVHLGVDGVLAVDHRVRSGSLLGEVDNCLGGELMDGLLDEHVVGEVADEGLHGVTRDFLPSRDPPLQLPDGHQAVDAHLAVIQAPSEIVHNTDVVVSRG